MRQPLIGIIGGKGKMGRYFTRFFKQNGFRVVISDVSTALNNRDIARRADVVVVAVPMQVTRAVIADVAPHIKSSGLLMDLTSIKSGPMRGMSKTRASYLGCHPLFAPTVSLKGQTVLVCPGRGQKWQTWWTALLKKTGAQVRILSATKHDRIMAYVQVLTHFADIALADTLRSSGIPLRDLLGCRSPVYRLELDFMGRILNQDPALYAQIQIQNPLSSRAIRNFLKSGMTLARFVGKKDAKAFERYFNKAAAHLGRFKKEAMRESDRFIKLMAGQSS